MCQGLLSSLKKSSKSIKSSSKARPFSCHVLQFPSNAESKVCTGSKVLDLGCSPGAWMQVACQEIGPKSAGGLVLGIDIQVLCLLVVIAVH